MARQLVKWKKKHAALKKNNDGLRNKQRKWVVAEATLKREAEALQQEEEKVRVWCCVVCVVCVVYFVWCVWCILCGGHTEFMYYLFWDFWPIFRRFIGGGMFFSSCFFFSFPILFDLVNVH